MKLHEGYSALLSEKAPAMNFENSNESGTTLKERDYIGLSEVNSSGHMSSSDPRTGCGEAALDLNESAATVLRLGLPAASVPKPASQRSNPILEEFRKAQAMKAQHAPQQVQMTPATTTPVYHRPRDYEAGPQKGTYSTCFHAPYPGVVKNNGVKRGYMETVGKGMATDVKVKWMSNNPYTVQRRTQLVQDAGDSSHKVSNEALKKHSLSEAMASASEDQPAQNQTVGWPPVRSSFRDNNPVKPVPPPPAAPPPACPSVQEEETPSSTNSKSCFVKIYMDGVPFGRKVDLKTNNRYEKLYSALEEMFQQFISGHYSAGQTSSSTRTSHFVSSSSSSSRKLNFLDGSEYVLIYEDHEGDFMLVGDVPWELFVNSVKRLRIMKGSEEVNLAPQNADPLKSQPAVG